MARNGVFHGGLNALLFYAGLEVGYNLGGFNLSSPQTTEWRVAGIEGKPVDERSIMKWPHMATGKVIAITTIVGLVTGNWFSFLGGLVAVADIQFSYRYARVCGRRIRNGGGYTYGHTGDGNANPGPGNGSVSGATGFVPDRGSPPLRVRP